MSPYTDSVSVSRENKFLQGTEHEPAEEDVTRPAQIKKSITKTGETPLPLPPDQLVDFEVWREKQEAEKERIRYFDIIPP